MAGIMASGVRVPDDIHVLAHCNWPAETGTQLPTTRLGFDAAEVLRLALQRVESIRAGQETPELTPVAAAFEDEVARPVSAYETAQTF